MRTSCIRLVSNVSYYRLTLLHLAYQIPSFKIGQFLEDGNQDGRFLVALQLGLSADEPN